MIERQPELPSRPREVTHMNVRRQVPVLFAAGALFALPAAPCQARDVAADQATPAAHVVHVEGARNFRDAGGYRTTDGRLVRSGAFYRSGSLGRLTPEGRRELQALGITTIIDLRTTQERARDGNDWLARSDMGYWTRDYGMSAGDMRSVFADPAHPSAAEVRAMMLSAYRRLPFEQAASYRELFARLAAPTKGAVVVNCTAGKDRTGIATALVLTALGVPYRTVRADFLLTNRVIDPRELQAALSGPLAAMSPEAAAPLLGVEADYLDTAFAAMRARDGSVDGYLRRELGVGPAQIAAIRTRLLR
jgi:protein-tyrosine phosphatase